MKCEHVEELRHLRKRNVELMKERLDMARTINRLAGEMKTRFGLTEEEAREIMAGEENTDES